MDPLIDVPRARGRLSPTERSAVAAADRDGIRQIGVFLHNRRNFGTLVCHVPLLSSLRLHYTAARLAIISPAPGASMLVDDGLADELRVWPPHPSRQYALLRALHADMLVTLRAVSIFVDLLVGLSGARIRSGFRTGISRWLFSSTSVRDLAIYRPLNYLRVLEPLGVQPNLTAYFEDAARRSTVLFDPRGEFYCLMPGGTWAHKRWGIENYLALATRIGRERPESRFVFVLGPGERDFQSAIVNSRVGATSLILNSPSLGVIAHAVLASRVTIANDCGPSHVAQLLGRPYVGLFANHRGQAEKLVSEWYFARPRSCWLSAPAGIDITAIPVETVYERAVAMQDSEGTD